MDSIKTDIDKKMDEQIKHYKSNYAHFKAQLDAPHGADYKILRECSEYKNIFKRINNSTSEEAVKFVQETLKLLSKYTVLDKSTEISINAIQDLFLLLTEQTTNPPTYKSNNFEAFSLSSIKLQVPSRIHSRKNSISIFYYFSKSTISHWPYFGVKNSTPRADFSPLATMIKSFLSLD